MRLLETSKNLLGVSLFALALAGAACTEQPVANTNTTAPNVNASPATNTNAAPVETGTAIDVREPDKYRATYVISGQTTGAQAAAAALQIEVARNGAERRYAFNIPTVGKVIFLDKTDKRYLVLQDRKQYMELTPETTGFEVPRAMTPGMLVEQLQRQRGVERVGEETLNGRTAVKYRYAGATNTSTQAGQVSGESFIYIDKETGLPLRAEGASAASGNVQGVSGVTGKMELRDIQTDVDPALFEIPQGMTKLSSEQVQQQIKMLGAVLSTLAGSMSGGMSGGTTGSRPATTTASPATNASPAMNTNASPSGSPATP